MKHRYILRVVIFLTVLTALIVGISIYSQQLLRKDSDNLLAAIEKAEKYMDSNNWKSAENSLSQVEKTWSDVKGTWSALIDHQEIDNIDIALSRLQMLVKTKEQPSSLSEAAALKKYIGHIPTMGRIVMENLL